MGSEFFIDYDQFITPSDWIIGIDPGHGGVIDGLYQTAPNKMYDHKDFVFYEGEFNRVIAVRLAKMLFESDISHYFTTNSNLDVSLQLRVNRSNNLKRLYKDKKHLFLSIHANAAPKGQESARGIEVFTSKGDTKADPMATIIFNNLGKIGWKMRSDVFDGDVDKEANFFVLRKTKVPAVLVELGFYTNKQEAMMLLTEQIQTDLAKSLYDSIVEIIKSKSDV